MKKARYFFLPAIIIILCTVCLTFSAGSESAPHFTVTAAEHEENGILTLENGQKWYKVKHFEDDCEYILTVKDSAGNPLILTAADGDIRQYVWRYIRYNNTTSIAPKTSALSAGRFSLAGSVGRLNTSYMGDETGDITWDHDEAVLRRHSSGRVSYHQKRLSR